MTALMPGSFDPFTKGHYDVAIRAAALFGSVCIAVMTNGEKHGLFTPEERAEICRAAFSGRTDIEVIVSGELLADLYVKKNACCLVKGVRNSSDYVYENELWLINRSFRPGTETVFIPSAAEYLHISSTMVREMLRYGLDLSSVMPEGSAQLAQKLYASRC